MYFCVISIVLEFLYFENIDTKHWIQFFDSPYTKALCYIVRIFKNGSLVDYIIFNIGFGAIGFSKFTLWVKPSKKEAGH